MEKQTRVIIYAVHDNPLGTAIKEGCEKHGCQVITRAMGAYRENNYEQCDIGVTIGLHAPGHIIQREFKEHETPLLIIDYGYIKRGTLMYSKIDEGRYYSLSLNGLNGRSDRLPSPMSHDRWNALKVPLRPWQTDGTYILVCGQKENDVAIGNLNPILWARQTINEIQLHTKRGIMFRPHPESQVQKRFVDVPQSDPRKPLLESLDDIYAVVAYNSNSLVEATYMGKPTFTLGEGSMVDGVTNTNLALIENPNLPDREQWAADLAWRQFTIKEMREGLLWEYAVLGAIPPVQKAAIDFQSREILPSEEFFARNVLSVSTSPLARRGRPRKMTEQPVP